MAASKPTYTFLFQKKLEPPTVAAYTEQRKRFKAWCRRHGYTLHKASLCDAAMSNYIHVLYRLGESIGNARNALYGLLNVHPELKKRMPRSRAALAGWEKSKMSKSYPPLSRTVTNAVAFFMSLHGYGSMAVATLLAFHCYLRASELCNLQVADVLFPGDARIPLVKAQAGLLIRKAKTGKFQWVAVEHPDFVEMLRVLVQKARKRRRQRLFTFSTTKWRNVLQNVCRLLQLKPRYVLHSLRHGGAVCDYLGGRPLKDIKLRGRWVSDKSLKTYLQAGRALLMDMSLPPPVRLFGLLSASPLLLLCFAQHCRSGHCQ